MIPHLILITTLWARYSIIPTLQDEITLDGETQVCTLHKVTECGHSFTDCLGYLPMSSLGEGKGNKIEPVSQGVYSSVGVIEK